MKILKMADYTIVETSTMWRYYDVMDVLVRIVGLQHDFHSCIFIMLPGIVPNKRSEFKRFLWRAKLLSKRLYSEFW